MVRGSVADPGCLSWSRGFRIPDPDPHQRIKVFLTLKTVSKLSEKIIWDVHPVTRVWIFFYPGSRRQKSTGSRIWIRNTGWGLEGEKGVESTAYFRPAVPLKSRDKFPTISFYTHKT